MHSQKDAQEILLAMLLDEGYCPSLHDRNIHIPYLYRLASLNKAEHVLLHVLSCARCKATTSKSFFEKLNRLRFTLAVRPLLFEAERLRIEKILKRMHISAVLFKHYGRRMRVGTDVDLLLVKKNLDTFAQACMKSGYIQTAKVAHKEIQLYNTKNRFKIDVHHLLAYPQYGALTEGELQHIRQFTQDLLNSSKRQKEGFLNIPIEWFVLSRIIHYWYNDMLCGIYPLYELFTFCSEQHKKIKWGILFDIASKYAMCNESIFILSLMPKLFGGASLVKRTIKIPIRVKVALWGVTLSDIVFFPPISRWHRKQHFQIARAKHRRYMISKFLINQHTKLPRLIRPGIFYYCLQIIFRSFTARRIAG